MSSQHTPGPWVAVNHDVEGEREVGEDGVRFWNVLAADGRYRGDVCSIHSAVHIGGISIEERDANARLIAEAPEFLLLLQEAAEFIQPFNRAEDLSDRIEVAIARAKGEAA